MQVSVESTGPLEKRLKVEVPEEKNCHRSAEQIAIDDKDNSNQGIPSGQGTLEGRAKKIWVEGSTGSDW